MRLRSLSAVAAGLLLTLLTAVPATASPGDERAGSVTLVTGDRVTVTEARVRIDPAPGRERAMFAVSEAGEHRYVIPEDARPLIDAGRLDKELFNVTALRAFGYRAATPVLVESPDKRFAAARPKPGTSLARLVAGHVKVWLDGKRTIVAGQPNIAQVGAPDAWQAGLTGTGATVAVLDTGIDETHPDLAGQVAAAVNFSSQPSVDDTVGHGTHVASIIAGSGAALGGRYTGVAPGAKLLVGKVCESTYCQDSAILAGMRWAVDQGADVVNMSLGSPYDTPGIDPLEEAVNTLSASSETLFVIAAGNSGPRAGSLGSPGTADAALTVGAVDGDDRIAPFSSRGPRADDGGIKPDITAPGVAIAAAKAAHGTLGDPAADPGYVTMSGTSMATPHVAGAAAILAQQHPDWTGEQLKAALVSSATPAAGLSAFAQGAGRADLTRAIVQTVSAEPAGLSFGLQPWPHDDDQPLVRQVTYRNFGPADVSFTLTVDNGPFTVSPATLTVPAGGQAPATVTADTRDTTGSFEGTLTATSGGTRIRTPLAVTAEDEAYALDFTTLDSQGAPDSSGLTIYRLDQASGLIDASSGDDGHGAVWLPRGVYAITAAITTRTEVNLIVYAEIDLDHDQKITLDSRAAGPIDITLPDDPAATETSGAIELDTRGRVAGAGLRYGYVVFGGFSNSGRAFRVGRLGGTIPDGEVSGYVHTDWRSDPGTFYSLGWDWPDQVPNGISKRVTRDGLALQRTALPAFPAGSRTYIEPWFSGARSDHMSTFGPATDISGITDLHLYASPGSDGARWSWTYLVYDANFSQIHVAWTLFSTFTAGRRSTTSAMLPVFGPTAVTIGDGTDWQRSGDRLVPGYPALFGDSAGNRGSVPMSTYTTTVTNLDTGAEIARDATYTYPLPPARTRLRLALSGTRADPAAPSSQVDAVWDFRSEHAEGNAALPLTAVRFVPRLDAAGTAPAGRVFAIPLQVQQYDDGGAGRVRRITAQVSYDDGRTWRTAPVVADKVLLRHPAAAGHVSLRAQATDSKGNSVSVTVLRAYALRAA